MAVELAEIFRRYGNSYRQKYAAHMPSTHLKAMRAIEQCRTEALVGRSTVVRIANTFNTVITPAVTGIVQNVRTKMHNTGWRSKRIFSCLCLTSCSRSHCLLVSMRLLAAARA